MIESDMFPCPERHHPYFSSQGTWHVNSFHQNDENTEINILLMLEYCGVYF